VTVPSADSQQVLRQYSDRVEFRASPIGCSGCEPPLVGIHLRDCGGVQTTGVAVQNARYPGQGHGCKSAAMVRIGCAGWDIPRVESSESQQRLTRLQRYSQVLSCTEINSSFYRPHRISTWRRWADSVPADFKFSVKFPKTITHEMRLNCTSGAIRPFLDQVSELGEKLGPLLLQLPPSLSFDNKLVNTFLSDLRRHYAGDVVCEPRHVTWFCDSVEQVFRNFEVARVAADPGRGPASQSPGGSLAKLTYFRLHGSPRMYYSAYSDEFLAGLSSEIKNLAARTTVWCVFDNTAAGAAFQNASELKIKVMS
jgi:uncharacterized protein YecE (DUF72 family)